MKKLSILCLLASFILSSKAAFALTQGSYITAEAIRSNLSFHERYYNTNNPAGVKSRPSHEGNDNHGGGLSYKYAFNYRGVYFAPGLFYERHYARADGFTSTSGLDWQRIDLKNRFGVKADIGFDVGIISPYITGGYSFMDYRTRNYNRDTVSSGAVYNGHAGDFHYGAGLKIEIPRTSLAVNLEYNVNNFYAKTRTDPATNINEFRAEYRVKHDIFKLGLSYNF